MALEVARAVIWHAPHRRPIGELLDVGVLGHDDLVWAAQKAYRTDVNAAAQTLLAVRDASPARVPTPDVPPAAPTPLPMPAAPASQAPVTHYGPRVVPGSMYLVDQEENQLGALGVAVGVTIILLLYVVYDALRSLLAGQGFGLGATLGVVAALLLGGWYMRTYAVAWRRMQQGRLGEEVVAEALRQTLDDRWTIYRNVMVPAYRADLDIVLVGPGGIWVVQVKAFTQPVRYAHGRWEYLAGRRWRAMHAKYDPGKVTAQAARLSEYLAKQGITRFVEPAIAFSEGQPVANVQDAPVPVWMPYTIAADARRLTTRKLPSQREIDQVNMLLTRRADEQRAVEVAQRKRSR